MLMSTQKEYGVTIGETRDYKEKKSRDSSLKVSLLLYLLMPWPYSLLSIAQPYPMSDGTIEDWKKGKRRLSAASICVRVVQEVKKKWLWKVL